MIHMMQEKDGPRKKTGNPATVLRTDTISKATTKEGPFTKVEPGDARAIRKSNNKKKKERKKKKRGGVLNQSRTRRCSYYKQAERLRTRRNYAGFTS